MNRSDSTSKQLLELITEEDDRLHVAPFVEAEGRRFTEVARQQGLTHIEAHVIRVPTPIPLTPEVRPDDLILKAEYADFLKATGLNALAQYPRPDDASFAVRDIHEMKLDHLART